ncbi:hypothetical protein [Streptomyces ortus]|uniref:Heme exporter protein D n=1 Tax=Streptomyces ortus TaxID=2867268 RepID=A0ABT3UX69_9ACTN|nr:hypothetical protein [Streptomyces ortus]MCX4232092.1 hypothetical protein [Streptomyces ortus]
MGPTPLDVANTLVTGGDLIDRHWPIFALLAAAIVLALAWRALRRASRYIDDLADEQQAAADSTDTEQREETP